MGIPMSVESQTSVLLWLSRLSKYTLVDVFLVIGVLVGIQLRLKIGTVVVIMRGEPRFGIIAFFLATVWEFIQIEWIKGQHDKAVLKKSEQPLVGKQLYFSRIGIPAAILVVTVGLYIAGLSTDFFSVRSVDYETSAKCVKSYNIISFGSALVNETSLEDNSAAGQTWFLCLVYFVLVLGLPVLTHLLQAVFLAGWVQSKRLLRTIEYTGMLWAFACVEILLIAALALEVNMEKLIKGLAGPSNEELVQVSSDFGPGFYILAVYSFVAGFLQFAVRVRNDGGISK